MAISQEKLNKLLLQLRFDHPAGSDIPRIIQQTMRTLYPENTLEKKTSQPSPVDIDLSTLNP